MTRVLLHACLMLFASACVTGKPAADPAWLGAADPTAPEAPPPAPSETLRLPAVDSRPAAPTHQHGDATGFTCPMHPEVRSATQGRCPKCGMALVPVQEDGSP